MAGLVWLRRSELDMIAAMSDVVVTNPNILGGTPVFAGTRVPVQSLFDYLKRGRTIDYFLEQFPTVTRHQVESLLDDAKERAIPQPGPPTHEAAAR